jgi:hypothetical protein
MKIVFSEQRHAEKRYSVRFAMFRRKRAFVVRQKSTLRLVRRVDTARLAELPTADGDSGGTVKFISSRSVLVV